MVSDSSKLAVFSWASHRQNEDIRTCGYRKRRGCQLSVVSVQSTNIPPREMVTYSKQTQTASSGHERDGEYEPAPLCTG